MNSSPKKSKNHENYIVELFKIILPYKWSIFLITLLAIILAKFYLYFIPSTYESYAVVKVKVNNKAPTQDILRDSLNKSDTAGIRQEMAILKTFKTNQKALNKINFKVKYFHKTNYKMIEYYKNSPVVLKNIHNIKVKFINHDIKLKTENGGFTLKSEELGESTLFPFNKEVKTPYFSGKLIIKKAIQYPIYIRILGNSRYIFESIIKNTLYVSQVEQNANLIKITFQDTIPQRANDYLDALVESYISQSVNKKNSTNNKIINFLDLQLEATRKKLEKSENKLQAYKSQNNVEPSVKSKDSFEKLSTIDIDLSELILKEKLIKNLLTFVRNNRNLDAIAPTLMEFNDQSTIRLIEKMQTLQQKEDELKIEFTDNYPKLISTRKQIKRIKHKILLNIKNLQSTTAIKKANLEKQKKSYETTLKELPNKEKQLIHFQRDYEVNSKMYTDLLEKKSENELIKVASVSDYEAIDSAYNSGTPIKPKRLIVLIIATILGFMFAIFISLLRALLVDKVKTKTDLELLTKLPIYGVIPLVDNNMFSSAELKEAYYKLATNIQFSKKEEEGSIILISSTSAGEGKTTTVTSLAGVFQNSHYKSVLVDFNMKEPSLHKYFGLEQHYAGVSTYLSQRDTIGNIIFSTNYPNLDIITAGPVPPNPSELMLSPRLSELFTTLKQKYDYIIIDTSSYEESIETLYLMQFTTLNLIVIRENHSKKSAIKDLENLVQEKNLKNMALVLKSIVKTKKIKKELVVPQQQAPKVLTKPKQEPVQLTL